MEKAGKAMKIIFATGNEGKMREIREILRDMDAEILSMKEAGIGIDIEENGSTFEENAEIKARAVAAAVRMTAGENAAARTATEESAAVRTAAGENAAAQTVAGAAYKATAVQAGETPDDIIVLADDSGLEIDALHKEPGIYSARYLGEDTPYSVKNKNLIDRLEGVPDNKRTARFVCAIAAVLPGGESIVSRGVIEGRIDYEEKGSNGFGYDPIFYVPEFCATTAQLSAAEKNRVSHRARALEAMKEELKRRFDSWSGI